jgi:hypothetical protein
MEKNRIETSWLKKCCRFTESNRGNQISPVVSHQINATGNGVDEDTVIGLIVIHEILQEGGLALLVV